jgi:hypothetical protein
MLLALLPPSPRPAQAAAHALAFAHEHQGAARRMAQRIVGLIR